MFYVAAKEIILPGYFLYIRIGNIKGIIIEVPKETLAARVINKHQLCINKLS